MADENIPVPQVTPEDAFKALESAPVTNPNAVTGSEPQAHGQTQHMGTPPADGVPGSRNEGQPAPAAAAPAPAAPKAIDPEEWLSEVSGGQYRKWDEVQAALNKPPVEKTVEKTVTVTEPLKFPNERAQRVYEAIAQEKYDVLAPFIEQHTFRSRVDNMTPEQLVKAHIKTQYPSFDDGDVQAEYDKMYKPDELTLNQADFAREQKKANDRLAKDAKTAKEEFLRIEPKLDLPMQQAAQPAAAQPNNELPESAKPIVAFGGTFKEDRVSEFPFEFESQDKTTRVTGKAALPQEAVTAIADKIKANPEAFLAGFIGNRWSQANGELDHAAIARDVALLADPGLLVNPAIKETYLQTYTGKLQRDRNYQPETPRGDASGIMPTMADEDKAKLRKFHGIPD